MKRLYRRGRLMALWQPEEQHYGLRLGAWWCLLKGPTVLPLFSENNAAHVGRDKIRVYPLAMGWRIVARHTDGGVLG